MKYSAETIDALASEFVLGTLRGKARARFSTLMRESREMREAVWRWEGALNGHGAAARTEQPDGAVWKAIETKISANDQPAPQRSSAELWIYRLLSGGLAALVLAVLLNPALIPDQQPDALAGQLALIQDASNEPLWLIRFDRSSGEVNARALNVPAQDLSNAYELWALVDGVPKSLGLLPVAGAEVQQNIPPVLTALLGQASGLAVSLEPAGGSPTGAPTGPVLYQAKLVDL